LDPESQRNSSINIQRPAPQKQQWKIRNPKAEIRNSEAGVARPKIEYENPIANGKKPGQ